MRDSGLGISLFRFKQVPSKVPDGLRQVDAVVYFRDLGLFWAISRLSYWFRAELSAGLSEEEGVEGKASRR